MKKIIASLVLGLVAQVSFASAPAAAVTPVAKASPAVAPTPAKAVTKETKKTEHKPHKVESHPKAVPATPAVKK